jgi:hypothetical protein
VDENEPPEEDSDPDPQPDTTPEPISPDLTPDPVDQDTRRTGAPVGPSVADPLALDEEADALMLWESDASEQTVYDTRRMSADSASAAKGRNSGDSDNDQTAETDSQRRSDGNALALFVQDTGLGDDLNRLNEGMKSGLDFRRMIVESAAVTSAGLTVGYVVWLLRGGMLLSSFLVQMPAWRMIDPLAVLQYGRRDEDGEHDQSVESLETIIVQGGNGTAPQPMIGSET